MNIRSDNLFVLVNSENEYIKENGSYTTDINKAEKFTNETDAYNKLVALQVINEDYYKNLVIQKY